jgi:hypothetical protein
MWHVGSQCRLEIRSLCLLVYHGAPTPSLSVHGTEFFSPAPCGSGVLTCG